MLVTGEPGIGKSRLTRALQERLRTDPHIPLTYYCSPYHQDSALHPIIGQLQRESAIDRADNAETKLDKLETVLSQSSENLAEVMPLFAALLSIPEGVRYPLPNLSPLLGMRWSPNANFLSMGTYSGKNRVQQSVGPSISTFPPPTENAIG